MLTPPEAPLPTPSRGRPLAVASAPHGADRRATWLELFFDLVFVVAVSKLAGMLLADPSPRGALVFLALFVPVWWAWIGISYFVDQFELPPLVERLLMLEQIALSIGLAVGLPDVVKGEPALFAWSYFGLRLTLVLLYSWAAATVEGARPLCAKYGASFALGAAAWGLALLLPPPTRTAVWAAVLVFEIIATIWAYLSTPDIPAQVSHMPERFGLFTIIVLGESVLAVTTGIGDVEGPAQLAVAACGVVLAFFAWWLYFDYADEAVIDRALRGGRAALYLSFVYGYTHLPVFAGIVATGVGVEHAVDDIAHGATLSGTTRLALCGGLALYLAAVSVVQRAAPGGLLARVLAARVGVTALLAALGLLGGGLPALAVVLGMTLAVAALVAFEYRTVSPHKDREIGAAPEPA